MYRSIGIGRHLGMGLATMRDTPQDRRVDILPNDLDLDTPPYSDCPQPAHSDVPRDIIVGSGMSARL